ncbi:NifU family protein [Candidatus Uhrbacteria bacterium]|nr:NifU family protein [Candidatus Uhrbacteria bacterium]
MEQQIEEVLRQIRPALRSDGGGIEFMKFDHETGVVHVRMQGACVDCPMLQITLKTGIESTLKEAISEVKKVVVE